MGALGIAAALARWLLALDGTGPGVVGDQLGVVEDLGGAEVIQERAPPLDMGGSLARGVARIVEIDQDDTHPAPVVSLEPLSDLRGEDRAGAREWAREV